MGTGYSIIIRRPTEGAFPNGEMSERLKELVLKTSEAKVSVGSNPTLSATILSGSAEVPKRPKGLPC